MIERARHGVWRARTALRRLETSVDPLAAGTAPQVQIALRTAFEQTRSAVTDGRPPPRLGDTGFGVFSQNDEDGILLFLLAVLGVETHRFVDIGAGDCLTGSNCANLALNLGFHGLFIEGDGARLEAGRAVYARHPATAQAPPVTTQAFVTRENIDEVIAGTGFRGPVDVLSIDLDGNDYWIWDAITVVQPRIVVIETHTEHGDAHVLAPYEPDYDWRTAPPDAPVGASLSAGAEIATRLGYRLVGGNRYGYNAFYILAGLAEDVLPTVDPGALLRTPWRL